MRLLIILMALLLLACSQNPQSGQAYEKAAEELQVLNNEYCVAWMDGDMETCLSMMTTDFVNYLVDNTQNREQVEDMFHNIPENMTTANAAFKRDELFVHDDMAYEFGYFIRDITPKRTGESRKVRDRYITVFKKQDGEWKFHRWMPQPDLPAVGPAGDRVGLKSTHLLKVENEETLSKLQQPVTEFNKLLADMGYPECGYVIYKVNDDYASDYTHIMGGWWLSKEVYDITHDDPRYKEVFEKYRDLFVAATRNQEYIRVEKMKP
jgi:ketosteroid isomerase-like protein